MLKCKHCQSIRKNKNSLSNHQRLCRDNPNRDISYFESHKEEISKIHIQREPSNQYIKAMKLGLPKPEVSTETRALHAKNSKAHADKYWSIEENHAKHSIAMKKAVRNNPDSYSKNNVCGRVKLIDYNGTKLKGSWEVKVAKWLDSNNIEWQTEVNPQEYMWNGSEHLYFPDFYIPNNGMYIEVKGFKRARDIAKWTQFKLPLIIIDNTNIHNLDDYNFEYVTNNYKFNKEGTKS